MTRLKKKKMSRLYVIRVVIRWRERIFVWFPWREYLPEETHARCVPELCYWARFDQRTGSEVQELLGDEDELLSTGIPLSMYPNAHVFQFPDGQSMRNYSRIHNPRQNKTFPSGSRHSPLPSGFSLRAVYS